MHACTYPRMYALFGMQRPMPSRTGEVEGSLCMDLRADGVYIYIYIYIYIQYNNIIIQNVVSMYKYVVST